MSREWMYRRTENGVLSGRFLEGVEEFTTFAYSRGSSVVDPDGTIICPCSKCRLLKKHSKWDVQTHLCRNGFTDNYSCWFRHGEVDFPIQPINPYDQEEDRADLVDMVMDMAGPDFQPTVEPHGESHDFYALLKKAEEPLWSGCKTFTKLSAVSELLALKVEYNMTDRCYDAMIEKIKRMLPEDHELPGNYYETKKMMRKLGMAEEKIDVCVNHHILYDGENKLKSECPECHEPRYKEVGKSQIPRKVVRYFPLTPRLRRLYYCRSTAKDMTWHSTHVRSSNMIHPSDTKSWQVLNDSFPEFKREPRNVVIGLSTDGFNPHGRGKDYSCWPVMITPYNLPPSLCNKRPYMFLTMIIPGPSHPGKYIDVYMRPLVDELKSLWNVGVDTYDALTRQTFNMKVALLWTISDFPAYGMLSGWSTHGKMSCPYCMDKTQSFQLENGRKPCFFDCHRQFLPQDHPYRKQKQAFRRNKIEKRVPPKRLTGDQIVQILMKLNDNCMNSYIPSQKFDGFGSTHNWTKISIFWELPYWSKLLIRHNLDVMHIEKNVFDNIFHTIMNVRGRTKDNENSRRDLEGICYRPDLHLKVAENGKVIMPKAKYALDNSQIKMVCDWLSKLKFPDGYASNISQLVDSQKNIIKGMKSHDCHVFMERLLPACLSRDFTKINC